MIVQYDESGNPMSARTISLTITRRKILVAVVIVLMVALAVVASVYQRRGSAEDQEVRRYVSEIGRLAVLPKDETPALGTITDPSKLGHQQFFKNSQKGDRTLIYSESHVVVLYRPSEQKIVNMGPVEISPLETSPSPAG